MFYNLVLVIFLANGVEHHIPLAKKETVEECVDLRDYTRGKVDYLNDVSVDKHFKDTEIEFVSVECEAQQRVY